MTVSRDDQVERAKAELSVLDGVIDYTDQMIYQQRRCEYEPLRRHAFGKTVVIETEKQGTQTFRLSSTPVVYPNRASGYATPHSAVGRLCSFLKPGDEDENPLWGEYQVLEVRVFDRFDGPLFEPNVRNFLRMVIQGNVGKGEVANLRSFLAQLTASPEPVSVSGIEQDTGAAASVEHIEALTRPGLTVDSITVVEEDEESLVRPLELEDEPVTGEPAAPSRPVMSEAATRCHISLC